MANCEQHGWSSEDWQNHVNAVLHQHFFILGLTYQRIADGVAGDNGLEGFSSDGRGYQAYADQDSNSKQERLEKFKKKIAEDIPKLETYKKDWALRLGDLKLREWTLVVPLYEDKAVLSYALMKAKEIRNAHLPFISKNFRASVCDINAFPAAAQQIGNATHIKLSLPQIKPSEIEEYEKKRPKDIVTIDDKLEKVATLKNHKARKTECRRSYLERYLYRENLLESLRKTHPTLWGNIDELLVAKGKDIVAESLLDTSPPNLRLKTVKDELVGDLSDSAKGLSSANCSNIAWGTIGHWLLNCNLRFNE